MSVISAPTDLKENDLPNCLSSRQLSMSADDTHITCVGVDANFLHLNLNFDLYNLIKSWLISNNLIWVPLIYALDKN